MTFEAISIFFISKEMLFAANVSVSPHCLNAFCGLDERKNQCYLPLLPKLCTLIFHTLCLFQRLIEKLDSDLRQTIAMTTTAMMKTKVAVADPTMSGSCSCHDFGGSALVIEERKWLPGELVTNIHPHSLQPICIAEDCATL